MELVWFRNDLRILDNPALYTASLSGKGVVAVAAITPEQWRLQDESSSRVQFWLANLKALSQALAALNIPLKLIEAETNEQIPFEMSALVARLGVTRVHYNREYPLYENERDLKVEALLSTLGVESVRYHADMIIPPEQVLNKQGLPYRVFTPFAKAWRKRLLILNGDPLPQPARQQNIDVLSDNVSDDIDYHVGSTNWHSLLWPAGADAAHQRLNQFTQQKLSSYEGSRDLPAQSGTSSLSPYLSVGVVSARQCLASMKMVLPPDGWLSNCWLNELIWREFYRYLLVHFPELNRWQPFRPQVEQRIEWQQNSDLFQAWCEGETGFSLVDAGMKQLLQTGWMHNRLRMVTASFLTKLLRQDWRDGAQFFMQNLIDGDFASNLGGWQWSASVGADAAPYFRIFNPHRQAERFDPAGEYVARWLPELVQLQGQNRHQSAAAVKSGRPAPIIDYSHARHESLAMYNAA